MKRDFWQQFFPFLLPLSKYLCYTLNIKTSTVVANLYVAPFMSCFYCNWPLNSFPKIHIANT